MAQYANLKNYFQNEHIKLIKDAVSNQLKDDPHITEVVIRSLVCADDAAEYNAELDLGVSVKTVGVADTADLSFIVTVRGNIEQRFEDIKVVGVKRFISDMFPADNVLSQFILPYIPKGEVERIGSDLYKLYSKDDIFKGSSISIERLVNKGMLCFSPLPDNCLGRIILSETDAEVIHNVETENGITPRKETIRASFGTILLNYNKYAVELDGSLRVTVAHELVHLQFHSRFLKLLQLLGEEKVDLHSTTETVALDENMSDIQKALCIAEWQADVLAMPLAIPAITVDAAIQEIANDPSTHYANYGDRIQACVNKFAKLYGVSPYIAKNRLRQLGYDFIDGTCLEYEEDGHMIQPAPFYFQPGTLKENETFIIDRDNYERLMRENTDFAELVTSHICVYTGYVVCLYDVKYIKTVVNNGQLSYVLTDYAREHADECCLKFEYRIKEENQYNIDCLMSFTYLCRLYSPKEYGEDLKNGDFSLSDDAKRDLKMYRENLKKTNEVLRDMENNRIYSLYEALQYYKKRRKLTYEKIAELSNLQLDSIKAYFKKPDNINYRKISLERLMIICNVFELEKNLALDLLNKAGYSLNEHEKKGWIYKYLLTITNAPIEAWNKILSEEGLEKLN